MAQTNVCSLTPCSSCDNIIEEQVGLFIKRMNKFNLLRVKMKEIWSMLNNVCK